MYHQSDPPPHVLDEHVGEGREHEGADAGAAQREAGRERAPPLEVEAHRQHRRHVDHTEPYTWIIQQDNFTNLNFIFRLSLFNNFKCNQVTLTAGTSKRLT